MTERRMDVGKRATPEQAQWACGEALRAVWRSPAPKTLDADLEKFSASLDEPFE